ncbi:MAG: cell division protein FtsK [Acidimicrobiales bacterium]|nr:cell division protein FtsK [Hyphomonadaceae bacterium]RZV45038.1 MAG: cell division protein FtsK [Acidimicrobiales bacterium]
MMFDEDEISPTGALRRAVKAIGVGGIGAIISVSILTYSPFDPTGDTAGLATEMNNFLGIPGANLANWLLQMLGWAALPLGLLLMFAAARAVLRPRVGITKWDTARRSGLLVSTIFFLSIFLAAFPIPQSWPMATGLGGWFGDSIFLGFKGIFTSLKINASVAGGAAAFLVFCMLGYCLGRFIGMVGRDVANVLDAAGLVWAIFRIGVDKAVAFVRRRFHKSYVEPEETAGYDDRRVWMEGPGAAPVAEPVPIAPAPKPVHRAPPAPEPTATAPVRKPRKSAKPKGNTFSFPKNGKFVLPHTDLMKTPPARVAVADAGALQKSAEELGEVLTDFGVKGEIGQVRPGPVVTLYEFEPAPGVKSSRVINLSDDIARSMAAQSARVAVVPGRNAIGIEMPNRRRETVYLKEMLNSRAFKECGAALPLALGEDIGGKPVFADLAKMPHLLVAGTTGSGKSVGINGMILSLMYTLTPEQCKFIMIDPKMLELSVYDGAPHLLAPVVTEPKKAVVALKWTVREMENRYRNMSKMGVRSIAGFNEKIAEAKQSGEQLSRTVMTGYDKETGDPIYETEELNLEFMPFIVVIIDEMADLMMVAGKDIEGAVQRLAQMARAAGIHMIMATQRPSVDVITGTIKANFPTRISFQVTSKIDSRTILGEQGAEQLLGMGDMLFMAGGGRTRRLHGPFVSDDEVEKIANFVKAQGAPSYLEDITTDREEEGGDGGTAADGGSGDETFDKAVAIVANDRKASTSYIQRRLGIGYNRAANLIERMEAEGMIGPSGPGGKREIFLPEAEGF